MPEQPWLDVLTLERSFQERVVIEIDLADRQVICGPPIGVHSLQQLSPGNLFSVVCRWPGFIRLSIFLIFDSKRVGALGTRGMSAVYVPRRSPAYFIHMDYFFRGLVTALLR